MENLQKQVDLICVSFGYVRKLEHQDEPQTLREHANLIQKGASQPTGWNPEPCCFKATVLTTAPLFFFFFSFTH